MDPDGVDVFPIQNGDVPASYVSLPEGIFSFGFVIEVAGSQNCEPHKAFSAFR